MGYQCIKVLDGLQFKKNNNYNNILDIINVND